MSRELQVTFRGGRLLAAYLYFQKDAKAAVAKTRREPDGMIVDFDSHGAALGIEFIAASQISLAKVNAWLGALGQETASADELWPLLKCSTPGAGAARHHD